MVVKPLSLELFVERNTFIKTPPAALNQNLISGQNNLISIEIVTHFTKVGRNLVPEELDLDPDLGLVPGLVLEIF